MNAVNAMDAMNAIDTMNAMNEMMTYAKRYSCQVRQRRPEQSKPSIFICLNIHRHDVLLCCVAYMLLMCCMLSKEKSLSLASLEHLFCSLVPNFLEKLSRPKTGRSLQHVSPHVSRKCVYDVAVLRHLEVSSSVRCQLVQRARSIRNLHKHTAH